MLCSALRANGGIGPLKRSCHAALNSRKMHSAGRILHLIPGIYAAFVLKSRTEWFGGYQGYGQDLRVVLPKAVAKRRCRTEGHARLALARHRRLSKFR